MNKTIIALFLTLFVVSNAINIGDLNKADQCAEKAVEVLRTQINDKVAQINADPTNQVLRQELVVLVQKVKEIYNACENKQPKPLTGDAIENTGIAFLLASNCTKDLGAVLLISDSIIQDPKNWKNDIIVLIFVALLGKQGYADCKQFVHFIHP